MIAKVRDLVQRNLLVKVISLLTAIVLWLVVMNDQNPSIENNYTIPIIVEDVPSGYKITYSDDHVRIRVKGPRANFVDHDSSDFKARLSLANLKEGSHDVKVEVICPQGFDLLEATPPTVAVFMDPFMEKQFRADLTVTGSPASGKTVADIEQDNAMVTVVGPKSAVETVESVVGYIGLTGNEEDFDLTVPLKALDADGEEVSKVRIHPASTQVHVTLARGLSKKIVKVNPVLGNPVSGYEVRNVIVVPAQVEIAGDEKVIGKLASISTETIPLESTADIKRTVRLQVPAGVTITNPEVVVSLDIEPVGQKAKTANPAAKADKEL